MDTTLGIDCPKRYMFENSCLSIGTPRRLSKDFEQGCVGDIVQPKSKRIKLTDPDSDESFGPTLRSHSTPRRSARIQKVESCNVPATISTTAPKPKSKAKATTKPRVWKASTIMPKENRTLTLRKQSALNRAKKQKPSNAVVMKPHFQKPKLVHTVPKTPELIRRLKAQIKRPALHKSIAEKENEEVKRMKKYRFRAAPVPRAVKAPVALPNRVKSQKPSTKPVTPKLTKGRKRKFVEEEPAKVFKAQPIPDFNKKSVATKSVKHAEAKPFSFDKRYTDPNANRQKLLEENLKEIREKAVFKATPYFKPGTRIAKENKMPSKANPFSAKTGKTSNFVLPGDAISKRKKEAFQRKIQEEAEKQKAKANNFRASSIRGR